MKTTTCWSYLLPAAAFLIGFAVGFETKRPPPKAIETPDDLASVLATVAPDIRVVRGDDALRQRFFLTVTGLSHAELAALQKADFSTRKWRGTVYVERPGEFSELMEVGAVRVGGFKMYGDAELIERIVAALESPNNR